ncbi:hypothetical protein [Massilia sp. TN1-12]|uniref:hypothetical protein n=1 Tax=Massilia paldalensis TaxID=3377675 RepID=UPI00384BDBF7
MRLDRLDRWLLGTLAAGIVAAGWFARRDDATPAEVRPAAPPSVQRPLSPAQAPAPARSSLPVPADTPPNQRIQVERLLASHDPHDAFAAYELVARCAAFNVEHDAPVFDEEELKHWKGDTVPGFRGMTAPEKEREARVCDGMTERERQSRLDYLAIAAAADVPGAAIAYAREGPFGDPSALETRPDDPLVKEWKTRAAGQLAQAAEMDADLSALAYLAGENFNGSGLTARDPLLAYRYTTAMAMIYADMFGPNHPMARMNDEADLTPAQRDAEQAAARRIADRARERRKQAAPGGG